MILYEMIGVPPQTKQQARVNHRNSNSHHLSQVSNLYFVTKMSFFVTKISAFVIKIFTFMINYAKKNMSHLILWMYT